MTTLETIQQNFQVPLRHPFHYYGGVFGNWFGKKANGQLHLERSG